MFSRIFSLLYWAIVLSLGVGSLHFLVNKMRNLAMEAASRPWPDPRIEMKQNNDADPFIEVYRNGEVILLHRDRLKR